MIHQSCDTLPLWCLFQVPLTGDYRYLEVRTIDPGTHPMMAYQDLKVEVTEDHSDAWENILVEFAKLNKDFELEDVFEKTILIRKLEAQYNYIITTLYCLSVDHDSENSKEYIEALRNEGYFVNTDNKIEFFKSLESIKAQAGAIITRMRFIDFEIKKIKGKKLETANSTFDDVMAWIHVELGVVPKPDITVRMYISYKEMMLKKQRYGIRH